MAKSDNGDVNNRSSPAASNDPNNSFMRKVTSRVSGLLPSSLSKWFSDGERSRQVIRRREPEDDEYSADEDDEPQQIQPPKKRARNAANISEATFSGLTPSGFTVTSTPLGNSHGEHLMRMQAGPSGYTRPQSYHLNGDDRSDSGESSGYSSVPLPHTHKESSSEKETKSEINASKILNKSPVTPIRSLFSEQSLTPNKACMSSRRPAFNASTFGSPSFVDRTLSTKKAINSPFYSGRTMYGGSAAYQRNRTIFPRDNAHKLSVKNSIQIKPVNETAKTETNHLSKTAKRILDALEHFSSPIADARKIPAVTHPRMDQKKKSRPTTKELMIPSVPDLLRMKLKVRLQDSTVAVRNVATSSKSKLNTEYSLRLEETEKQKHSNKIKSKVTSVREKNSDISEVPQEVILPDVPLPITTLPKFDFSIPPPAPVVTSKPVSSCTITTPKKTILKVLESQFKFASPISINDAPKSVISINNFKFSQPLDAKNPTEMVIGFKYTPPANITPKKKESPKNNGQNNDITIPTASKLLTGSVMDILGKTEEKEDLLAKFKPVSGTWECTTCMVRNIPTATRCVACETLKEPPKKVEKNSGFANQFKMSADKWECGVCMIRNDNKETKCVACTTPKPGTTTSVVSAPKNITGGFGDKFKPASDTWECSVCMVRNKINLNKCVACETPKPGFKTDKPTLIMPPESKTTPGFTELIKKQQSRWECTTCLVRNPNDANECTSCGSSKPGMKSFKFGTSSSTPQFKFGIDKSDTQPTGFKFGVPSTETSTTFSFGVKPVEKTTETTAFTFGVQAKKRENVIVIPDDDDEEETDSKKPKEDPPNASKIIFTASTITSTVNKTQSTTVSSSMAPVTNTFAFGGSNTTILKSFVAVTKPSVANEAVKPMFSFGTSSVTSSATPDASKITFDIPKTEVTKAAPIFAFAAPTQTSTLVVTTATQPVSSSTGTFTFSSATPITTVETKPLGNIATFQVPQFNFGSTGLSFNTKEATSVSSTVTTGTSAPTFNFAGSSSSFAPPNKQPFNIANKAEVKPFSFGTTEPATKVAAFNFKGSESVPAKPIFNFSSNPAIIAEPTGTNTAGTDLFNFNANKPEKTVFGSVPDIVAPSAIFTAPQTQTPQNGGFNFGAPAVAPPSFKFGATNPAPTQTPAVFGFGQAASVPTVPGTYSFGSNAPTNAFSPDAKPNYNFTTGTASPSFTAQIPAPSTSTGGAPVRKIRKAVRRMQPR